MDKNETIINNLKEFIAVLDNQIDLLNENLPTSKELYRNGISESSLDFRKDFKR